MDEMELVREYARTRSDTAFAELSRRYVNLVYSSALRQVGDPALAEDVTQATFLVLARKAHRLRADVPLSSWLLTVTRYAAKDAIKSESRRKRHEQKAAAMNTGTPKKGSEDEATWDEVAPLLDDAVANLGKRARSAIVLRYFERKPYQQVAEEMGVSEVAARQRVSRALEQLRAFFAGRGIVLSAIGLKAMMRGHAVVPAPASVGTASATMGSKGLVVTAKHAAIAHSVALAMIPLALKWTTAAAIVVLFGAGGIAMYRHSGASNWSNVATFGQETGAIQGAVVDREGKPVDGAEVLLAESSAPVAAYGVQRENVLSVRTGADGKYELPRRSDGLAIVVRSDQGYAQERIEDLDRTGGRIVLSPWARIEGTLRIGGKLRSDDTVELIRTGAQAGDWDRWHVMHEARVKTSLMGRFVFPKVIGTPKDDLHGTAIRWMPAGKPQEARYLDVQVEPGGTAKVVFGGDGVLVKGKIDAGGQTLPPFQGFLIPASAAPTTLPTTMPSVRTPPISFTASIDGGFQVEDVPPGEYDLDIHAWVQLPGSPIGEEVASARKHVTIVKSTIMDQPVDVGTLVAVVHPILKPGDPAPDFSAVVSGVKDVDLTLSQLRGKLVLLYARRGVSDEDAMSASLKPVFDRFCRDSRFEMIELSAGSLIDRFQSLRQHAGIGWKLAFLRSGMTTRAATTLPSALDAQAYFNGPFRLFLIDSNGRLVAKSWDARDAYRAVDQALGRSMEQGGGSVRVNVERVTNDTADQAHPFQKVPYPSAIGNVARSAKFSIVDGVAGRTSGTPDVLHDGLLPAGGDEPMANFSFDWGSLEGRLGIDLGALTPIREINTYSRHRSERGPQVYAVYGSDGAGKDFEPVPKIGADPTRCGWKLIGTVDSRPATKPFGGRYAVSLTSPNGSIGNYRYILFETFVTESDDDWGHTFFSEIDVIRQPEEKR